MQTLARAKFYQVLGRRLQRGLSEHRIEGNYRFVDQSDLQESLDKRHWAERRLVLVIDEFEEIPDA